MKTKVLGLALGAFATVLGLGWAVPPEGHGAELERIPGTTLVPTAPGNAADCYVALFASLKSRTHGGARKALGLGSREIELLVKASKVAKCCFYPKHYAHATWHREGALCVADAGLLISAAVRCLNSLNEQGEHEEMRRILEALVAFEWHLYRQEEFNDRLFAAGWLPDAYKSLEGLWASEGNEELAGECRTQRLSFGLVVHRHTLFLEKSQEDFSYCKDVALNHSDPTLRRAVMVNLVPNAEEGTLKASRDEVRRLLEAVRAHDPDPLVRGTASNLLDRIQMH